MKVPPRPGPLAQAFGSLQAWMSAHGVRTARLSIGTVYFWFGVLKFAPVVPGAEIYLPGRILSVATFGLLDRFDGAMVLATWECLIGYCLVAGIALRLATFLMFAHLLVMFLPMALWPRQVWHTFPFGLTIKGQIVLDNLVMIACGMMLASSVPRSGTAARFGRLGRWVSWWDDRASRWMGRHGVFCLRISMGVLYLWFGALKYVPSAGEFAGFAGRILSNLSGGLIAPAVGLPFLATWECLIGVGLLLGRLPRLTLTLILLHLLLMTTPLLLEPEEIWIRFPFVLTLTGKFLIRHLVLYGAAIVIISSLAQRVQGWSALVNPFTRGGAR